MIKKYLKAYLYTLSIMFISIIIITIFNYFNIINSNTSNSLKLITIIISIFIGSFIIGKNSHKKGYLEGIKYALIFILFILLLNILIFKTFNSHIIIYYIIILISSIFGAMLGINFNHKHH